MSTGYRHLDLDDRVQIEKFHDRGMAQAQIARSLGVHRSTISRELRRGSWRPSHTSAAYIPYRPAGLKTGDYTGLQYRAVRAQKRAASRAEASHQKHKFRSDALVDYVINKLRAGWSPESISGRLSRAYPQSPGMQVSVESIYAWIYSPQQAHRGLWQYLHYAKRRRRARGKRRVRGQRINWRTSIHDRPTEVTDRTDPGHWESDSVIGAKATGVIHTSVERRSRYLQATKLTAGTAADTVAGPGLMQWGVTVDLAR